MNVHIISQIPQMLVFYIRFYVIMYNLLRQLYDVSVHTAMIDFLKDFS